VLICGIKASHDGGVALIDGDRLVFSVEVEKLGNGLRYSPLGDLNRVGEILAAENVDPNDVDRFVVDGWWTTGSDGSPGVETTSAGRPLWLPVAPYVEGPEAQSPLTRYAFDTYNFNRRANGYASYHHASNHLLGSYCSSPFAARREDALVVVWDGAMCPRAYAVDGTNVGIKPLGMLFGIPGNFFADFCSHFDPFHRDSGAMTPAEYENYHLSIAGKAMAYAALGNIEEAVFPIFDEILDGFASIERDNVFLMGKSVMDSRETTFAGLSNADLIATFQAYLGKRLLDRLAALVGRRFPDRPPNLCLAGGCALNIKWNSTLRASGLFADVWIPPFPNDSGAAIGTAACEMFTAGRSALTWDVYRGPHLRTSAIPPGWDARPCDETELARILHEEGEPVVLLTGRAELGPRALGSRSILAPAVNPAMKDRLNAMKNRASYRPVAPICLVRRAHEVFDPGTADPYMLFEHAMRPGWAQRVPTVVHLDGTARLQTVDSALGTPVGRVLEAYERLSGIPVLCNTSANLNGHGFFPDVLTAAEWGGARYIWSDGQLYTRIEP
jgi:carbamoyltransferase